MTEPQPNETADPAAAGGSEHFGPPAALTTSGAADAYRRWSADVGAALVDYLEGIGDQPVGPAVAPGWLLERLPDHPPAEPEDFDVVLRDVAEVIRPALVNWQAPGFYGYFPANTSWPAAFADFLAAGLGQQGMVWATSPAATELEMRMLDWVAELCGLPEHFCHSHPGPGGGVIQDSASSGTLVALLAARERAGGRDQLARQVVYHSAEAHSSVIKGARIAGFREEHIRAVPTDDALAMSTRASGDHDRSRPGRRLGTRSGGGDHRDDIDDGARPGCSGGRAARRHLREPREPREPRKPREPRELRQLRQLRQALVARGRGDGGCCHDL